MGTNIIEYHVEDSIITVKMNRPKNLNSIDQASIDEFNRILDIIETDTTISAVIITGGGNVFSAGADIKFVMGLQKPEEAYQFVRDIQAVFNRLENLEKPSVAAISGLALGGGCELAMACDIRISTQNARFGLPEINIGVLPAGGGTQRLPRLIGASWAKELLYTGDIIDAQEAYRVGLVNKLVKDNDLIQKAGKLALKLGQKSAVAMKMIKQSVNHGMDTDLLTGLKNEAQCFKVLFETEDRKEGMSAFIEKRVPAFKGK